MPSGESKDFCSGRWNIDWDINWFGGILSFKLFKAWSFYFIFMMCCFLLNLGDGNKHISPDVLCKICFWRIQAFFFWQIQAFIFFFLYLKNALPEEQNSKLGVTWHIFKDEGKIQPTLNVLYNFKFDFSVLLGSLILRCLFQNYIPSQFFGLSSHGGSCKITVVCLSVRQLGIFFRNESLVLSDFYARRQGLFQALMFTTFFA